jgi:hypothetical protein
MVRGSGTGSTAAPKASKFVNTIFGFPVVKWMYNGAVIDALLTTPKNSWSEGELLKILLAQPPVVTSTHQVTEPETVDKRMPKA